MPVLGWAAGVRWKHENAILSPVGSPGAGVVYFRGVRQNPHLAATAQKKGIDAALLAKANAGDAEAQYQLGNMYNFGDGVRRDYAQASSGIAKVRNRATPSQNSSLADCITSVMVFHRTMLRALFGSMKAAEQGHTDAEFFISTCYGEGWGVPKDDAQEMAWLRRAAEQGHFNSQLFLGRAYAAGIDGVPWTTRKPISGWTLLHRERSHVKNGKRLSRGEIKLRLA